MTLIIKNFRGMALIKKVIFFCNLEYGVRGILEYALNCDVAGEFLQKLCTFFRSNQISYLRLTRGLNI